MNEIKINIKCENKEYPIFIGSSIIDDVEKFIASNHPNKKIIIITDDNINSIFKPSKTFNKLTPLLISVPSGESSKTREKKQEIEDLMLKKKIGRDSLIIAFGGGVIGDLAGFTASTFCRGIPFIQIPTTLLAMVDSSIGGKTAVDTKYGKNLIGTFAHPEAVFADLNFLEKLPKDEFINGLAEIIKIACTSDKNLFSYLEKNYKKILDLDKGTISHIIQKGVELKKEVVELDEKESGYRQILNFGHTFGHAYELYSNYNKKHGSCISLGIVVETSIAVVSGELNKNERLKIISLLELFNLPTKLDKNIESDTIIELMSTDKKNRAQKPRFVILKDIGKIKSDKENSSFEYENSDIKKAIEDSI